MSIQSEITRITNKRDASFVAVANKGVTVPAGSTIDDLPDLIDAIPSGGGSIVIQDTPDSHGGTIREITAQTVISLSAKTITQNGTYNPEDEELDGYSSVVVAVPSGTAGTPTATKSSVSNHSVSVTPSVTNTTGYIIGGTINGSAVTVSASELVSGNLAISENGTGIDVANYSTVSVNVSSGGGKAAQTSNVSGRATSSTYTAVGPSITVAKTGTYDVYWVGYRSSTSGTSGSQLYINGTAYGSAQTTFNTVTGLTNIQNVHLSNVPLTANSVLTIRARSRGNNYYMYIMSLTIIEA